MDEHEKELARLLYTRVGMVMEDASAIALELGSPKSDFDPVKLERLEADARTIVHLINAAQSIVE